MRVKNRRENEIGKALRRERDRKEADEQFIADPFKWPYWPCLPLRKINSHDHTIGLMLAEKPPYKVYVGINLFGLNERPGLTWEEKLAGAATKSYGTVAELLAEWRID